MEETLHDVIPGLSARERDRYPGQITSVVNWAPSGLPLSFTKRVRRRALRYGSAVPFRILNSRLGVSASKLYERYRVRPHVHVLLQFYKRAVDAFVAQLIYLNSSASTPWIACTCVPCAALHAADTGKAVEAYRNNVLSGCMTQDTLAETPREPLPARETMRCDAGETERLP